MIGNDGIKREEEQGGSSGQSRPVLVLGEGDGGSPLPATLSSIERVMDHNQATLDAVMRLAPKG